VGLLSMRHERGRLTRLHHRKRVTDCDRHAIAVAACIGAALVAQRMGGE